MHVGIGLGRGLDRVLQEESDADDDVAVLLDEPVDVGPVVGVGAGLDRGHLDAEFVLGLHESFVTGLVEGFVVEAALVGDHAGLVVAVGLCP